MNRPRSLLTTSSLVASITILLIAPAAHASDVELGVEHYNLRLLIPIAVGEAPGAGGSLWRTETLIRNDGSDEAIRWSTNPICWFSAVHACDTGHAEPGQTIRLDGWWRISDKPASLYYVHGTKEDITVSSHVYEVSSGRDRGTEIPVVWLDELSPSFSILNIPVSENRATLRLYVDPSSIEAADHVVIEIWSADVPRNHRLVRDEVLLKQFVLSPRIPLAEPLTLSNLFDGIENVWRVRVTARFEPMGKTSGLWGMVTLTDNVTHQTTVYSPQ